jgi:Family of unknown function (DUF6118)
MNDALNEQGNIDLSPVSPAIDPAAAAFELLREEVALIRRAVAGLAAERAALGIPDYSETLATILRECAATTVTLKGLAAMPALRLTARDWARELGAAGSDARRYDEQMMAQARCALREAACEIAARLSSARLADRQRRWLQLSAAGALLAGILIAAFGMGPVVRAMPENWHVPERVAAYILGMDQEAAGARLIADAAPERWRGIVFGYRLVSDNRDAIARCRKGATIKTGTVRCTIAIKTEVFP